MSNVDLVHSDVGGPARSLALAPDSIRCEKVIDPTGAGSRTRCSRFTIKRPDGTRDRFCVSHSQTAHAEALRSKAARAQEDALKAERARRAGLLDEIAPIEWSSRGDFNQTRHALFSAFVRGDITAEEVRELRTLVSDAERSARSHDSTWHPPYVR